MYKFDLKLPLLYILFDKEVYLLSCVGEDKTAIAKGGMASWGDNPVVEQKLILTLCASTGLSSLLLEHL